MIPDINLLPKQFERQESESKLVYIIITILFLLMMAFLVWQFFDARADIETLQEKETLLQQQRENLTGVLETLQNNHTSSLKQSVEFVEKVSYPVSPLIDEMRNLEPNHSFLREFSFSEKSVTISIDIETLNDVAQYIERLNNSPYFTDVQIMSINELLLEDEEETDFNEVPRQTTELMLMINENYLAAGGDW